MKHAQVDAGVCGVISCALKVWYICALQHVENQLPWKQLCHDIRLCMLFAAGNCVQVQPNMPTQCCPLNSSFIQLVWLSYGADHTIDVHAWKAHRHGLILIIGTRHECACMHAFTQ